MGAEAVLVGRHGLRHGDRKTTKSRKVLGIFAGGIGRGRSRDSRETKKRNQNSENQIRTRLHVASLKSVVAGLTPMSDPSCDRQAKGPIPSCLTRLVRIYCEWGDSCI